MLNFPDPSVETEYTDPNTNIQWTFDGIGWVQRIAGGGSDGGGSGGDGGDPDYGDPHWSDVALLINCDGEADLSQNIVDATNKNYVTVVNDTKVSTSEFKYGTGSVQFIRGGLQYLSLGSGAVSPKGVFTIEAWFKPSALLSNVDAANGFGIIAGWGNSGGTRAFYIDVNSAGVRSGVNIGGTNQVVVNSAGGDLRGRWSHVTLCFDGTAYYTHLDGTLIGTYTSSVAIANTPTDVRIGNLWTNDQHFDGFIDEVRITDGVARYTQDNFLPPGKHPTKEAIKRAKVVTVEPLETQEDGNDVDLS